MTTDAPAPATPAAAAPAAPATPPAAAPAAAAPAAPATPPAAAAPAPATPAATPPATPAAAATPTAPATAATPPATPPADAPKGAPEKYEFTQVQGITLSDKVLAKYGEVAKSLNLSQVDAQKVLTDIGPAIAQQQAELVNAQVEGWKTQASADKEIGGPKLQENLGLAKKGMDAYFSKDFVDFLNKSGLGNHPELIRGMMKVGATVSQDRFITGGDRGSPTAGKSAADILYPPKAA